MAKARLPCWRRETTGTDGVCAHFLVKDAARTRCLLPFGRRGRGECGSPETGQQRVMRLVVAGSDAWRSSHWGFAVFRLRTLAEDTVANELENRRIRFVGGAADSLPFIRREEQFGGRPSRVRKRNRKHSQLRFSKRRRRIFPDRFRTRLRHLKRGIPRRLQSQPPGGRDDECSQSATCKAFHDSVAAHDLYLNPCPCECSKGVYSPEILGAWKPIRRFRLFFPPLRMSFRVVGYRRESFLAAQFLKSSCGERSRPFRSPTARNLCG